MLKAKRLAIIGLGLGLAACAPDQPNDAEAAMSEAGEELEAAGEDIQTSVQSAMDEMAREVQGLEGEYAEASDEARAEWTEARAEIQELRRGLDDKLARLAQATPEEVGTLEEDIADDVRELRLQTERARLNAVEESEEFVRVARTQLTEIDGEMQELSLEVESLATGARMDASNALTEFQQESLQLKERLDALANESAETFAEERDELIEAIAELSASVRHQLFAAEQRIETP